MIPVLLLLLPVLALGVSVTRSPEPIHIPLARRSLAGRDEMSFWAKAADHIRAKYGYDTLQRRQTSAAIPLTNAVCFLLKLANAPNLHIHQFADTEYVAMVNIGTPYVMCSVFNSPNKSLFFRAELSPLLAS
jgi:hypothetical protein